MLKKHSIALVLFLISYSAAYAQSNPEISVCHGKFNYTGEPVNVMINWETDTARINQHTLKVVGTVNFEHSDGTPDNKWIITEDFVNKFNYKVVYTIGISNYLLNGTFIKLVDLTSKKTIDFAELSCSKSFEKPFMKRMLSPQNPKSPDPLVTLGLYVLSYLSEPSNTTLEKQKAK